MSSVDLQNKGTALDKQVTDSELVSEDGRYVTEEEYWEKYYEHPDFNYEWNNGILEEKPVSDFQNYKMYKWFRSILERYLAVNKTGEIVEQEFGFRLALPEKVSIRKPDLAVVVKENPEQLAEEDRSFKGTYDLCVELISDLSRKAISRDTVHKKTEYEDIGVREYFILDASSEHMAFYRRDKTGIFQHIRLIDKDIIRSEVLKGFQLRFSDLFRQPKIEELTEDEVYRDFIFPALNKAKQQAELEKQRAEQAQKRAELEKQRAEQAEKRAELLAEKLRSLGISID